MLEQGGEGGQQPPAPPTQAPAPPTETMEATKPKDITWTVFIPGGDLCTDAQIIESTDDEASNSAASDGDILNEEDLHLHLSPTQSSASTMETSATDTDNSGTAADSFTDSQTGPSIKSQSGNIVDCHAPPCASCNPGSRQVEPQASTPEICRKYTAGTCRYGIRGEKCKYSHPEACRALLRYGQWKPQGCKKGEECEWFHPICREALTKDFCTRGDRCRYQHPKSWQRIVGDVAKLSK